jgi:hypothetical protein
MKIEEFVFVKVPLLVMLALNANLDFLLIARHKIVYFSQNVNMTVEQLIVMAMVLAIMNSQRMAKVKQNANVIRVFKMMA